MALDLPSVGLNTAFAALTNLLGIRSDPYQAFNFLVEIEGILAGSFSECTGLQVETEYFDYREGGVNDFVHRFAGPTKYPPLILKHGLTQLDGLWNWHQDVTHGTINRKNGTIYLLDNKRIPMMWWNFKEAYPVKYTGPDFRADSANVAFESVELTHRGLSRPTLGSVLGAAGSALAGVAGSVSVSVGF
jgi:phage tail-like protein